MRAKIGRVGAEARRVEGRRTALGTLAGRGRHQAVEEGASGSAAHIRRRDEHRHHLFGQHRVLGFAQQRHHLAVEHGLAGGGTDEPACGVGVVARLLVTGFGGIGLHARPAPQVVARAHPALLHLDAFRIAAQAADHQPGAVDLVRVQPRVSGCEAMRLDHRQMELALNRLEQFQHAGALGATPNLLGKFGDRGHRSAGVGRLGR